MNEESHGNRHCAGLVGVLRNANPICNHTYNLNGIKDNKRPNPEPES